MQRKFFILSCRGTIFGQDKVNILRSMPAKFQSCATFVVGFFFQLKFVRRRSTGAFPPLPVFCDKPLKSFCCCYGFCGVPTLSSLPVRGVRSIEAVPGAASLVRFSVCLLPVEFVTTLQWLHAPSCPLKWKSSCSDWQYVVWFFQCEECVCSARSFARASVWVIEWW